MNMADPTKSAEADDLLIGDITEHNTEAREDAQDPEAVLENFRKEWRQELQGQSCNKQQQQAASRSSPSRTATPRSPATPAKHTPQHLAVRQQKPTRAVTPVRGNPGLVQSNGDGGGGGGGSDGGGVNSETGNEITVNSNSETNEVRSDVEIKAADLFNKAVELEQNGCLYEAIQFYRRAMTLVPDIEFRVHRHSMLQRTEGFHNVRGEEGGEERGGEDGLEEEELQDLVTRFQMLMVPAQAMCSPQFEQEAPHISCLPPEMLDRIMRWVVGSDLDTRSLEQVSRVCRGFFLVARNPEIWHKACLRIWGINCGVPGIYGSWRQMFIQRPHPRFNGCYISRTTYFRCGESNFQDVNYQPWHLVEYYRYVRFFPDGVATMLTTPDDPVSVVAHLRTKEPRNPQALRGVYRIHGSTVSLVFKRQSREMKYRRKGRIHIGGTTDVKETTFQIEFEIRAVKQRPHWQLCWQNYNIVSKFYDDRQNISQIDVNDTNKFPPLAFSRVKSYTGDSDEPLM